MNVLNCYILWDPVGRVATEGVLSQGYMLACADQLFNSNLTITVTPYKYGGNKRGGDFHAFNTASDDRITLPEA